MNQNKIISPTVIKILLLLIVAVTTAFAQEPNNAETELFKGNISGKVIDKNNKQPIPYVNVQILGTQTGAASDIDGEYLIKSLDEEVYKIKFTAVGFTSHIETDVRVIRNKTTIVKDIELVENPVTIEGVEVTSGLFSNDAVSPLTNFNYSREEIRRAPGAGGDIFRAIETLPGVSSSGGEFSAFSVRGASPRDNIVIVDNIPFDKVSHFDGGTEEQEAQGGRFSIFTTGLIDEANFQAGGFAAEYGGKNASFIDLRIKEGNKESFTVNGTYDLLGWEVNYDGPTYILKNTSALFSARHLNFKSVLSMIGQKDLGYPSFSDVILKTTTELSPKHKLSILGIYAPEEFERNIDNVYEIEDNNYDNILATLDDKKYLLGANWRYLTGEKSFLENTVYYRGNTSKVNLSRSYVNEINGVVPSKNDVYINKNYLTTNNKENELGLKTQFTYNPSPLSIFKTGLQIQRINYDYAATQNDKDTLYVFSSEDYRPDPTKNFLITDPLYVNNFVNAKKFNYAAFADYSYFITECFRIMPGVRYEYSEFNSKGYISPRLSASYQLSDRTKLSAATGIYYQSPELRIISFDKNNALLDHERAIHYIAGITTYLDDDIKLTVEVYHKDLNKIIVRPDRTTQLRTNTGTGYVNGIDIGIVKKFLKQWYGQINYSYTVSKRNDNNGTPEYNSDFSQPHIFNILFGYEFNKEWSFSTKWKYATGRPKDSYIVHSDIFNDPNNMRYSKEITGNNTERLPDFHTWNIRVDYRKQFGDIALVAFIDILNLYNRLNVNEERFIESTGKNDEKGFKMIPTIGMKLEF